ncbi:hypothetical protein U1Q18_033745 [Sarracenia purpurea var. burkii]
MRPHNLSGPPWFLFTINEESKEDLESNDGRSRGVGGGKGSRAWSLGDLLLAVVWLVRESGAFHATLAKLLGEKPVEVEPRSAPKTVIHPNLLY